MPASNVTLMGSPKMVGGVVWAFSWGGFSVCNCSQVDGWKDDRHGVVSSTKHSDLVDEFVGDFHEDILR